MIDVEVMGGTPLYAYNWSTGGSTQDVFNLIAGSYSVVVTDPNGCSSLMSFTVTEPSNPIIVNGTITDATGPSNNDGAVDVTVTGGTPPYSFMWASGEVTEDLSSATPGVYSLTVMDANGCTSTAGFTVNWTVGIADEEGELPITVFPNPTNGQFMVKFGENIEGASVIVRDAIGREVEQRNVQGTTLEFDLSGHERGLYLIEIRFDDQVATTRIILQ